MNITVFTPTYNRSHTLKRTFESLCNQSDLNFEWLIVDDGSTDDTQECVAAWSKIASFRITCIKKRNGGLHTGYNTAISNIDTELAVCCDSDDYMPSDAIEVIKRIWSKEGNSSLAGIIGLDFDSNTHEPIGGAFADTSRPMHFLEIESKLRHRGDVKMVFRTDLLKPYVPMKSFEGEKNFNPIYLFLQVDPRFKYILTNKNLCFVDYQAGGMTANIFNQYVSSPRSFAEIRKVRLSHPLVSWRRKFRDAVHLVSSACIAHDLSILKDAPKKPLVALASLPGFLLYKYILAKTTRK